MLFVAIESSLCFLDENCDQVFILAGSLFDLSRQCWITHGPHTTPADEFRLSGLLFVLGYLREILHFESINFLLLPDWGAISIEFEDRGFILELLYI